MVMFINRAGQDELEQGSVNQTGRRVGVRTLFYGALVVCKFRSGLVDSISGFWKIVLST